MFKNIFTRKAKDVQPKEADEVTGAAPPQPRPNFFQRAKLRLLETVRRPTKVIASCPSSDCSVSVDDNSCSISSSPFVSQFEEPEPIVRVNMVELLPMELLAHMVSYLPPEDFNSLSRTNKTAQLRLHKKYRRPIRIILILSQGPKYAWSREDDDYVRVEVLVSGKWFDLRCNLKEPKTEAAESSKLSVERQLDEIRDFFSTERESAHRKVFKFGIKEGLKTYLDFLHFENVKLKGLRLVCLKDEVMETVKRSIEEKGMRVHKLYIRSETFEQNHYDMLIASKAKRISMRGTIQLPGLLQTKAFRELSEIHYIGKRMTLKEGDLPSLAACSLNLEDVTGITSKDIQTFLNQWIQSRRNIELVHMANCKGIFEPLNCLNCLDPDLVTVEEYKNRYPREWRLIRNSDDEAISMKWSNYSIKMIAEDSEAETESEYDSELTRLSSSLSASDL